MKKITSYRPLIILSFCLLCICLLSIACKKSSGPIHSGMLMQNWSLVRDIDSFEIFNAVPIPPSNYTGTPNDYFDFRTDGNLYISENGKRDTFPYISNSSSITITRKIDPYTIVYTIAKLTNDSLSLHTLRNIDGFLNSHDYQTEYKTFTR
jgi:hypothetical protein